MQASRQFQVPADCSSRTTQHICSIGDCVDPRSGLAAEEKTLICWPCLDSKNVALISSSSFATLRNKLSTLLQISLHVVYLHTPCTEVLLEKLNGSQLVKKFPALYGTLRLLTAVSSARQLSLSWASLIHSMPPHHTSTSLNSITWKTEIFNLISFKCILLRN
jgi:hypothetical protein